MERYFARALPSPDEERYYLSSPQAPHDDDVTTTFGGGSTAQYTIPDAAVSEEEKRRLEARRLEARRLELRELESDTEIEDNSDDLDPEDYQPIESLYNANRPQTSLEIDDMQREGILHVLRCLLSEEGPQGCLLAHNMSCEMTMQVITALAIIANAAESNSPGSELIPNELRTSSTLILCPASLVQKWVQEFENWAPSRLCRRLGAIRGITSRRTFEARSREIDAWVQSGGVLIMSYDMHKALHNNLNFNSDLLHRTPNVVVADEARHLSNPMSRRTQVCRNFATRARIGISAISMSNEETVHPQVVNWVSDDHVSEEGLASRVYRVSERQLQQRLPQKTELTLIIPLTEIQQRLYDHCNTKNNKRVLLSSCCAHPSLLSRLTRGDRPRNIPESFSQELLGIFNQYDDVDSVNHSYRTTLTDQIVEESLEAGDKVVIFSQSLATLNYLEHWFNSRERRCCRIDGATAINRRQPIIDAFNTNSDGANVCLISTKTGGLGFDITGANRVIIFDSGKNPTHMEQAVGRVYRVGQQKAVFVYRLISGGTYEEPLHNTANRRLDAYTRTEVIPEDLSHLEGVDTVLDSILRTNHPIAKIHMSATVDENDWNSLFDEDE